MTEKEIIVYNDGLTEFGKGKGLGQVYVNDIIGKKTATRRPKTDFNALFGEMCEVVSEPEQIKMQGVGNIKNKR